MIDPVVQRDGLAAEDVDRLACHVPRRHGDGCANVSVLDDRVYVDPLDQGLNVDSAKQHVEIDFLNDRVQVELTQQRVHVDLLGQLVHVEGLDDQVEHPFHGPLREQLTRGAYLADLVHVSRARPVPGPARRAACRSVRSAPAAPAARWRA